MPLSSMARKVISLGVFAGGLAFALASGAALAGPLVHRDSDGTLQINPLLCYTDFQVRQAIADAGFSHIFLNAPVDSHIQVRATKGTFVYLIDFNYCSGNIVGAQRLRPAQ